MTGVEAEALLRSTLSLTPVPGLAGLQLHLAHSGSGLRSLLQAAGGEGRPPYFAYAWGGGLALAHHLRAQPGLVAGRSVLDLGAGSGLVGIVAAQAGARRVLALDTDPLARVATGLNARANGVEIQSAGDDLLDGAPPEGVGSVLVGDLFYEAALALRTAAFLARCRAAGLDVLVGDPGRASLPRRRLRTLAAYPVRDMGGGEVMAEVFAFTS